MKNNTRHREEFLSEARLLGFDDPFLEDHYNAMITQDLHEYGIDHRVDYADDRVLYCLDLRRNAYGLPYPNGFQATLLKTHPIQHGIFHGIDTAELEKNLKEQDWNTDMDKLSDLFGKMLELTSYNDDLVNNIVERLQARYWIGTAVSNHINVDRLKTKFGHTHYFQLDIPGRHLTTKHAYNLLSGRSVMCYEQLHATLDRRYWLSLRPLSKLHSQMHNFEEVKDDAFDLRKKLDNLEIEQLNPDWTPEAVMLLRKLLEGDIATATVRRGYQQVQVRLSVDPVNEGLIVYEDNTDKIDKDLSLPPYTVKQKKSDIGREIKKGRRI